jgi:hypothetical protein
VDEVVAVERFQSALGLKWPPEGPLAGARVVKVACGALHSAALTADGRIFTWGWADWGVLGRGVLGQMLQDASPLSALRRRRATHVSCGTRHVIVVTDSDGNPHAASAFRPLLIGAEGPVLAGRAVGGGAAEEEGEEREVVGGRRRREPGKIVVPPQVREMLARVAERVAQSAEARAGGDERRTRSADGFSDEAGRMRSTVHLPTATARAARRLADVLLLAVQPVPGHEEVAVESAGRQTLRFVEGGARARTGGAVLQADSGRCFRVQGAALPAHRALLAARWPALRRLLACTVAGGHEEESKDEGGDGEGMGTAWVVEGADAAQFGIAEDLVHVHTVIAVPDTHFHVLRAAVEYAYVDKASVPPHRVRDLHSLAGRLGATALARRLEVELKLEADVETEAGFVAEGVPSSFVHDMAWLRSPEALPFTDCTLSAEGEEGKDGVGWRVNLCVLLQSPFFAGLEAFAGKAVREGADRVHNVHLGDVNDDEALDAVLQWMYTGHEDAIRGPDLAAVLELSARFGLNALTHQAEACALQAVDEDSADAVATLADQLGLPALFAACQALLRRSVRSDAEE